MTNENLRADVIAALQTVAPEIEPAALAADRPLRRQVDLDSMDWLNFLIALGKRFTVEIPESEAARLVTLDDIVAWLAARRPPP